MKLLFNTCKTMVFVSTVLFFNSKVALGQLTIDAEGDIIASVPYNTVRIPASGGTQFDIARDLSRSNDLTYRLRLSYTIKERHVISLLYAPLTLRSRGVLGKDVVYSGGSFSGSEEVTAKYKFNSYRFTYRYMLVANGKVNFGLGLTGKVRDANITLRQENVSSDYPDLGFVPLINFYFGWQPTERIAFILEGDALASRQGRAEDIFAGIAYYIKPTVAIKGGYRLLEGGADVERNYNFTWVNYIPIGLVVTFK
jgi:hypothetical protein